MSRSPDDSVAISVKIDDLQCAAEKVDGCALRALRARPREHKICFDAQNKA